MTSLPVMPRRPARPARTAPSARAARRPSRRAAATGCATTSAWRSPSAARARHHRGHLGRRSPPARAAAGRCRGRRSPASQRAGSRAPGSTATPAARASRPRRGSTSPPRTPPSPARPARLTRSADSSQESLAARCTPPRPPVAKTRMPARWASVAVAATVVAPAAPWPAPARGRGRWSSPRPRPRRRGPAGRRRARPGPRRPGRPGSPAPRRAPDGLLDRARGRRAGRGRQPVADDRRLQRDDARPSARRRPPRRRRGHADSCAVMGGIVPERPVERSRTREASRGAGGLPGGRDARRGGRPRRTLWPPTTTHRPGSRSAPAARPRTSPPGCPRSAAGRGSSARAAPTPPAGWSPTRWPGTASSWSAPATGATGAVVSMVADGTRSMASDPGDLGWLADVRPGPWLDGADWLFVSGYALLRAPDPEHLVRVAAAARAQGTRVAVDLASASMVSRLRRRRVRLAVPVAGAVGGVRQRGRAGASRRLRPGHAVLVVKRGAAGACFVVDGVPQERDPGRRPRRRRHRGG